MARDLKNTAIFEAYDDASPFDPSLPEKNLLRALLLSAMSDLRKPGEPGRRAREYFLSEDDEYVFSFHSVCTLLTLDPKQVLIVTGLRSAKGALNVKGPKPKEEKALEEENLE